VLQQLLFLAPAEAYFTAGEPCGSEELAALGVLQRGLSVGEDMVTQLCLMGLLPTCPLPPAAALDALERVVQRAATAAVHDASALQVSAGTLCLSPYPRPCQRWDDSRVDLEMFVV
jgi:hypothetical protein